MIGRYVYAWLPSPPHPSYFSTQLNGIERRIPASQPWCHICSAVIWARENHIFYRQTKTNTRRGFNFSGTFFSVVQVQSLVNIERKLRKSMFSQSLCLPSKDQEIFFFAYFQIFWPEICMCRVLDQTLDVCDIDPLLKKLFWLLKKCCLKLGAQFLHS